MKRKSKLLITVAAIAVLNAGLLTSQASAFGWFNGSEHSSSLVQKIADRFGLNKDEVQSVVDEFQAEMHAKQMSEYEIRLDQLVSEGKITAEQKELIIEKKNDIVEEWQAKVDELRNMSPAERKAAKEAFQQELAEWAAANNIDLQYLMNGGGKRMGKMGMYKMRSKFSPQPSTTPAVQ